MQRKPSYLLDSNDEAAFTAQKVRQFALCVLLTVEVLHQRVDGFPQNLLNLRDACL